MKRPNMAKDVTKKKQRIAHNKTNEGQEMYPECQDFLTSIVHGMDNTDLFLCTSNFQNFSETTHEKAQNSIIQIPRQNHTTTAKLKKFGLSRRGPLMEKSQRTLKQLQHNRKVPKPRAHLAGLSVSQSSDNSVTIDKLKMKDLNNKRSTSKFQNTSTMENKTKRNSIGVSKRKEVISKKLKPVMNDKCPVKESSRIVESVSKKHDSAIKKSSLEKSSHSINRDDISDNSSDSDKYENFLQISKGDLPKKPKSKTSNVKSQKSLKKVDRKRASQSVSTESESDMTEESVNSYKSRKLRKTHNRCFATSVKDKVSKKDSRKFNSRTTLRSVSSSSDSDASDGPSTSYNERKKKRKNKKSCGTSEEDGESKMDINDEAYHNSSSETDDLPPPSEIIYGLTSTNNPFSGQMDNEHKSELSLHSNKDNVPSMVSCDEPNILCIETSSHENSASLVNNNKPDALHKKIPIEDSHVALVNSNQPNILHNRTSSTPLLGGSDQLKVLHKSSDISSLASVHVKSECVTLKGNSESNNSQQENSPKSLIIDLVESDNECDSSFTVIPKIIMTSSQNENCSQSHSEESDIELVDVVIPPDLLASAERLAIKVDAKSTKNNSEFNIKTEKSIDAVHSTENLQNIKLNPQPSLNNKKYEVAYATGICQKPDENDESKDKIRKQLNLCNEKFCNETDKNMKHSLNNELQSSSTNAEDSPVYNKVKTEPSDDDCEIILDTFSSNLSLANVQINSNKSIKVEEDCSAVQQRADIPITNDGHVGSKLKEKGKKLYEIPCSTSLKSLTSPLKIVQPLEDEINFNIRALLEDIRREFRTYEDIIQTEESVESTFKILERHQAEKLKSMKTKLSHLVERLESNSENNAIKIKVNKLLDDSCSELSRSTSLKCSTKVSSPCSNETSTSDISLKDVEAFANMNLVPLSSISEKDIKPTLSELQYTVKQEPSSSYEINSMSFGEKCIVCCKDASAACQQCAKVFFCSNECGRKYWEAGHKNACVK